MKRIKEDKRLKPPYRIVACETKRVDGDQTDPLVDIESEDLCVVAKEVFLSDARHIVMCVNHHNALVSACEEAIDQLGDGIPTDPDRVMQQISDVLCSVYQAQREAIDGENIL